MAEFTQVSSLTGFFYEIYDKIVDPIPTMAKLMSAIPFKGGALEIGNKLHVNVIVSDEGGFTYAARDAGARLRLLQPGCHVSRIRFARTGHFRVGDHTKRGVCLERGLFQ